MSVPGEAQETGVHHFFKSRSTRVKGGEEKGSRSRSVKTADCS